DGLLLELVLLNAAGDAEFVMGSPRGESGRDAYAKEFDPEKQHPVKLTTPYYLGKYPVTQEQYEKLTGKNPSHFAKFGVGRAAVTGMEPGRFLVETVSWNQAISYCDQLTKQYVAQLPAEVRGRGYQSALPTEAQWEFACRSGTATPFHFGTQLNGTQAN